MSVNHEHKADARRYTHNSIRDGYDRCVETCECGATRTLTRELFEDAPTVTEWAHSESVRAS
jgi:hypothetical protein